MPTNPAVEEIGRRPLSIAILSCKRPHYLYDVLASLRPQVTKYDEIFLFQDGSRHAATGHRIASEVIIDQCGFLFQKLFPGGRLFRSAENLGIAGNYRRAETYLYECLNREVGLFLEDDMALAPNYLNVVADLSDMALASDRIGYVSAYGDLWATLEEQQGRSGGLQRMHENWGAAMTRASYEKQKPVREAYWALIKDCRYADRPQEKIRELYRSLGFACDYTTQDSSRWIACVAAGMTRLTTATCHARYIGAVGEHSDNAFFLRHRFDCSQYFPERPRFALPSARELDAWVSADLQDFARGYRHAYQQAPRAEAPPSETTLAPSTDATARRAA